MESLGSGLAWMGFWIMIGLANFGESPCAPVEKDVGTKVFDYLVEETDHE